MIGKRNTKIANHDRAKKSWHVPSSDNKCLISPRRATLDNTRAYPRRGAGAGGEEKAADENAVTVEDLRLFYQAV